MRELELKQDPTEQEPEPATPDPEPECGHLMCEDVQIFPLNSRMS